MSTETPTTPDTVTTGGTLRALVEVPFEQDSGSDPNRRTHIVRPADNGHRGRSSAEGGSDDVTAQDIVDAARLLGKEVRALCGHVFVPKHNPEHYPACERCIEMAGLIDRGEMR